MHRVPDGYDPPVQYQLADKPFLDCNPDARRSAEKRRRDWGGDDEHRADHARMCALAILAENPDGCSRAVMLARGFPLSLLNRLVRAGLATSHIEREERGDKVIEIVRVKITEAGRRALQ
jgi:hypothetical protein